MKTKHIILTVAVLFFSLAINAQDKYEFMIIAYFPAGKSMVISIDGKEVVKEDVDASRDERAAGGPLLKKISKYQDENWEVMTFTNSTSAYAGGSFQEFYAYLKKKKVTK